MVIELLNNFRVEWGGGGGGGGGGIGNAAPHGMAGTMEKRCPIG